MAFVISLKIETIDAERRDAFVEALIYAIQEHAAGVDKLTAKVEREGKTSRGKRKITDIVEWLIAVEEPPNLTDFGLAAELPLERALRDLSGTEIRAGGKTVKVA